MIIRYAPIDSHWYRAAAGWFVAFFLVSCLAFPAFDELGYDFHKLWPLLWVGLIGTAIFYGVGKCQPKSPTRVLEFILVAGCFATLPMVLALSFGGMAFFILTPNASIWVWIVRIAYIACAAAWSIYALQGLRARLAKTQFIKKELRIEEHKIVLSRAPKTSIDPERIPDSSLLGRTINRAAPLVGLFLFMGYPIQRLLTDAGGVSAVMLFLSVFLIPWSIHAIGQFVCGTYLWLYSVWRLERQHGKPVVFEA